MLIKFGNPAGRASVVGLLLAFALSPVSAAPVSITCQNEDVIIPGWTGPLSVKYDGAAAGTMKIKSEHIDLTVPVKSEVRTGQLDGKPHSVTGITGAIETTAIMPDLPALKACAAKTVQPEFKDDADMLAMAILSCLSKTPPAAAPVPISASVSVALIPGGKPGVPDVTVEIKRSYRGGAVSIDTSPKNCVVSP